MNFRQVLLVTHRWLGLSSAVVLFVTGLTGAMLAWPGLFGRWPGRLHETLAIGRAGWFIVLAATVAAVALQISGLYLWWRTRKLRVRASLGWRRFATDLHHALGALGLVIMLLIALSAIGRIAGRSLDSGQQHRELRQAISDMHTTRNYPQAVKVLFAAGSVGFAIQGVTGVAMWWRPRR